MLSKSLWSVIVAVFLLSLPANAQVPQIERDALIALYNSTRGDLWTENTGWKTEPLHTDGFAMPGTECTWFGVGCDVGETTVVELTFRNNQLFGATLPSELGDLSNLEHIDLSFNTLGGSIPSEWGGLSSLEVLILYHNFLTGSIPPELGSISGLRWLYLNANELSGSIPPELGNLSSLEILALFNNRLSGSIPPELGNLSNLLDLDLSINRLSGSIPPELGALSSLRYLAMITNELSGSIPPELGFLLNLQELHLRSNQLTGNIPSELGNLASLEAFDLRFNQLSGNIPSEIGNLHQLSNLYTSIRYNALWTDDPTLQAFLDSKDPGWDETQTIAPEPVTVVSVADRTVWLEWTPILYTADIGGYEVLSEEVVNRAPSSGGYTTTKADSTFPVTGLQPGQTYDLTIVTFTRPHTNNDNHVLSEPSAPVTVVTSNTGCETPVVTVSQAGSIPYTLSVTSAHDTYVWSTGETTSSVVVSPHRVSWHWVMTTGPGACAEAAVAFTPVLFFDGFETGDFEYWSGNNPR